jgi:hypothetical protein
MAGVKIDLCAIFAGALLFLPALSARAKPAVLTGCTEKAAAIRRCRRSSFGSMPVFGLPIRLGRRPPPRNLAQAVYMRERGL